MSSFNPAVDPVLDPDFTLPSWAPDAEDIADVLPNRAQDILGQFTTTTNPTITKVNEIIYKVSGYVSAFAGTVPDSAAGLCIMATECTILGTASRIELSFTSGGTKDLGSKAAELETRYQAALAKLRRALAEYNAGQVVGGANDIIEAQFIFPAPVETLFGALIQRDETNGGPTVYQPDGTPVDPFWGIW